MAKNKFWTWFWLVLTQIWFPRTFMAGFSSNRCYTLLQGKLIDQIEKIEKKLVSGPILAYLAQIQAAKMFFQKRGFVSHEISWSAIIMFNIRKTNDPILRKLKDERPHGRTDRWTRVISKDAVWLTSSVQKKNSFLSFFSTLESWIPWKILKVEK